MKSRLMIQDLAFLLDYDISNLSKFEKGEKSIPTHITLGYHIISNEPLFKYFQTTIISSADVIARKAVRLIAQLEEELQTDKVITRIEALEDVLRNIGCLKALSETESYEPEGEE